jgi:hypothetical protein
VVDRPFERRRGKRERLVEAEIVRALLARTRGADFVDGDLRTAGAVTRGTQRAREGDGELLAGRGEVDLDRRPAGG